MSSQRLQIPSIKFSNLDPNQPNGSHWDETRTKVFSALETYDCFNTIYNGVESELNETLFGSVMPKMFELPLERKQMSKWGTHFGYHGKITDVEYESIAIRDAVNPISMEQFAQMFYQNGNQLFSNTVSSYAQRLVTLDRIVERMIFQTLSIDKHYDSHLDSLVYGFRLSVYGELKDKEAKVSLPSHVDSNFITVIYQNGIAGLEVLSKDGDWIRVVPSSDSFIIMIGESMTVLSNGRLQAPFHRVSVDQKRYSVVQGSLPKEGHLIEVPKEIIDENPPLKYNPFDVYKYMQFRYSPEGRQIEDPLKDFCGILEK